MEQRTEINELLPFYALDALSEEERNLVEEYLAGHPEARQQLDEMIRAVSALPHAVTPVEPPTRVKDDLMRRLAADAQTSARIPGQRQPSRRAFRFQDLVRPLSLATAVIAILWIIALNVQVSRLGNEVASLNARLAAQGESLNRILTNLPQANPVITVSLRGTELEPQVQGQLIANPESQSAVLIISGLPRLEAGKTYQVWLIDGGTPVSAGLLTIDENGQAVFIVSSTTAIGSFKALGISVEPQGGSPQPTGEIVVLSDL